MFILLILCFMLNDIMFWCVWVCVLQKLNIGVQCQMQVWVVVCRFLEWMYVLGGGGGGGGGGLCI